MQFQVIKCKCGEIFAASRVPECYQDSEWMRDLRKEVKNGNSVEIVEQGKWKFGPCKCKAEKPIDLFSQEVKC